MAEREKTKHSGIYKVGKKYYATWYVGEKKFERVAGKTLKVALQFKMDRERENEKGITATIERQENMTLKDLAELYEKEGDGKRYILEKLPTYIEYFGKLKLSEITKGDLFAFKKKIKATPRKNKAGSHAVTDAQVNRVLAGLRRLFAFAVIRDCMIESPFPKDRKSGLFYPEQKGLRNFFKEDEMEKIIEATPNWLKPMILTLYYTGLRVGEMLKLQWENIDLNDGVIYLPSSKTLKDATGRGQKVVMQWELVDLFKSLPKRSEWVFFRWDGEHYRQNNIYKPFKKVLKELGVDEKNTLLKNYDTRRQALCTERESPHWLSKTS
jgi:integrase